ncbi:MAG TPA: DUF3226 domain-containing protein [Longimicrobium sp.]|nr:DUF3226 domain-containing protein [Longimicrobium sp.]
MRTRNTPFPRVLWVEGKDDSAVVQSLCEKHQIPEVFHVVDKEGLRVLLRGLSVELRARGVERFGIVVDANGDVAARWASIRETLQDQGYADVPENPDPNGVVLAAHGTYPRFGAWLMPDNTNPGMLEDFAAALVPPGDDLWAYAAEVIDGIAEERRRFGANERSKAHIHTWLAWQKGPGSPMGQAIGKGDLDGRAPHAERFMAWLRRLMIDD